MNEYTQYGQAIRELHHNYVHQIYNHVVNFIARIPGIEISKNTLDNLNSLDQYGNLRWPNISSTFTHRNEVVDLITFEGNPITLSVVANYRQIQVNLHWRYNYQHFAEKTTYRDRLQRRVLMIAPQSSLDLQREEQAGTQLTVAQVADLFSYSHQQYASSVVEIDIYHKMPEQHLEAIQDRNKKQLARTKPDRIDKLKEALHRRYLTWRWPVVSAICSKKQSGS